MPKGKHTSVEGPIKSTIMGCGGFGLLAGGAITYNGHVGAGLLIFLGAILVLWLGSKIPNKNRVEW